MKTEFKIAKDEKYGFSQVKPLPTAEELERFYNTNYYDTGTYAVAYSPMELTQKVLPAHEIAFLTGKKTGSVLDIGCGEGFILDHLKKEGWKVTGLDFSHDGINRHFPHLKDNVIKGDIYKSIEDLIEKQVKFDVIICNNVLEHVRDPISFLERFKALCHADTVVRIQVPNDFSWIQEALKRDQMIRNDYWVVPPAHLSYFNNDNFASVLKTFGYEMFDLLGDFPIEIFLLNEKSNYNLHPEVGPLAHKARLYFDVNLFKASLERYVAFRRGCGQSGVCRNLIAYCKVKSGNKN
jgi:2-polyprenyl-3-methyl-5-hydroxy-6-metoxy-1,4-benzoquinol methylase